MSPEKPTPQNNDEPTVRRFRKKPVEIQAIQWDGTAAGASRVIDWVLNNDGSASYQCSDTLRCAENDGDCPHYIAIRTLEGTMQASLGDWIIQGVADEFYPCKPDIFEATYDAVELGVTKGLPELATEAGIGALKRLVAGIAPEAPPPPSKVEGGFQHAGQEAGKEFATAIQPGPPGPAAPKWIRDLIDSARLYPLNMLLPDDVVAVQLPEPDHDGGWPIVVNGEPETVWFDGDPDFPIHGSAFEDLTVTEASNLAAALLAATQRAEAAE